MKIILSEAYAACRNEVESLPHTFSAQGRVLHSGRNEVRLVEWHGRPLVVKRYKKPNAVQCFAYSVYRPTKAARAFRFAARLRAMHIDTPREVAYIECRCCGLIRHCYFVSEPCNDPSVASLLPVDRPHDEPLVKSLTAFLASLHRQGFLHGDLNLSNILCRTEADGHFHFTLIDTNRSRFVADPAPDVCIDNLKRVTHQRPLLQSIAREYARLRGWDEEDTVRKLTARVEALERKEQMRKRWKNFF